MKLLNIIQTFLSWNLISRYYTKKISLSEFQLFYKTFIKIYYSIILKKNGSHSAGSIVIRY